MVLPGFPMPPSSNNMYRTGRLHSGRIGRFKSKDMREWENECLNWALRNGDALREARLRIQQALRENPRQVIRFDAKFWFPTSKVLNKMGLPKRLDTSNRIKPLHDFVAESLAIDDCLFWNGSFEKKFTSHHEHAWVDIELSLEPIEN